MSNNNNNNLDPSEYTTQLSDAKPRFDCPIRISLPSHAPDRSSFMSNDQYLRRRIFSSGALVKNKTPLVRGDQEFAEMITERDLSAGDSNTDFESELFSTKEAELSTAIKDFNSIAYSSHRVGKRDVEGNAFVSLGVIYDNQQDYIKAIEQYDKYLKICEEDEANQDVLGIVAACNCLSVDYIFLASPPSEAGTLDGVLPGEKTAEYIEKAIAYSERHLRLAPDDGGKFVALTNLGLCCGMKKELSQSGKYHQDALRIAIKMQTLYGQSISVGNLGLVAFKKKDYSTATTCFQQHIQLVQALMDVDAEVKAWISLATINQAEQNYVEALLNFENAMKIAEKAGFMNELRRIHCLVGLTKGKSEFSMYLKDILRESTLTA